MKKYTVKLHLKSQFLLTAMWICIFFLTVIYKNITSHFKYILLNDILYLYIKGESYLQAIIKQVKVTVSPHNLQEDREQETYYFSH